VGTFRKVKQPFTFSNGVTIMPGETLAAPVGPIHFDDTVYDRALQFDGFRFSKMRERDGESAKVHSVNTGTEFLTFGHGEHAWYLPRFYRTNCSPGRFFAVSELKLMLAFVLLKYDIKSHNGKRPANWEIGIRTLPNMSAEVLFKIRS
jgi:cytochrome P450